MEGRSDLGVALAKSQGRTINCDVWHIFDHHSSPVVTYTVVTSESDHNISANMLL